MAASRVEGLAAVTHVLDTIASKHLKDARGEIRTESKKIADRILIPALKRNADAADVPIASRMSDTSRARSDRIVFVKIGAVNPKLSGFRRGQAKYRTGMAWGSERGGPTYAVGRNRGYWVRPTVEDRSTVQDAADQYTAMLHRVFIRYGGY
jgi:hypothetical protein